MVGMAAGLVHMTMPEERLGVVPDPHRPDRTASHNIPVVLVPPVLWKGAFVLRLPRFSLRML